MTQFLPVEIEQLTEPTSIALAQHIKQSKLATPLSNDPILTTFVQQGTGGIPILLLHGFDSSVFEFRRLLPLLAEQHETWAVDLLGFGFTDRPPGLSFSPDAIKAHLYTFWQTHIQQPIVLVGASMGGAAAIDFALAYPEVVDKLVLIGSAGWSEGPAIGKFLIPPVGFLATEFLRNPGVRRRISQNAYYNPSLNSLDAQLCTALHLTSRGWSQALVAFTKSGGYRSFRDKLVQLKLPALILWGDSDRILGIADAPQLQQAIANSHLIWIEQCGHVPHLEHPQITADHLLRFISSSHFGKLKET